MSFLPIVERELRVAARRQMTFWLRVVAALAAILIASGLLTLFMNVPTGIGTQLGAPLFAVLTWMSLAVALVAGLFFTSDALSEEKREGTLGFLFLTDLRGYDVVLGKLLATSCRCVFALLAIFPVLACTQLLGGVEVGEFWRTILALLHTLFFSLAAGIFISSISRHPQKALVGTLALLFVMVAGGAAMDGLVAFGNGRSFRPVFSLASPVNVFMNASRGYASFWQALLVSEIVTWVMLAAACYLIPRTWQEKAARVAVETSPWRTWWRFGGARRREYWRSVVMDKNPLTWLAGRERWQSFLLWAVAVGLFITFAAVSLIDHRLLNWLSWSAVSVLATLLLYLWTASQASQVFAEMRRAGLIELLLAAPLDCRKVAPGAWWGLVRLFGVPIGIILLVQFLAAVTGVAGAGSGGMFRLSSNGRIPDWVMLWLAAGSGLILSLANLATLTWFGLWMGLTSRNSLMATLKTIVFVQIIPLFVITFSTAMIFPILLAVSGGFGKSPNPAGWIEWFPILSTLLGAMLNLGKDWLFFAMARGKLVEKFRDTAISATLPIVWTQPRPPVVPPGTPPVIPTRAMV